MTVGSATGPSSYIATEFMDLESHKWSSGPEYPFHSKISSYSTADTSLSSYIIGDGDRHVYKIQGIFFEGWRTFFERRRNGLPR